MSAQDPITRLPRHAKALRVILGLTGIAMLVIALNTSLGGMVTLGWQFSPAFMDITDPPTFDRQDNNARFFAGTFAALSLFLAASSLWLERLRALAVAFFLAIAVGGLFRLLQPDYSVLGDPALLPSILAEAILCPILALWTARSP